MRLLLTTGEFREPQGRLKRLLTVFSCGIFAFGLWANLMGSLDPYVIGAVFVCLMLSMVVLLHTPYQGSGARTPGWYDWLMAVISLAGAVYIYVQSDWLLNRFATVEKLTPTMWFFGVAIVLIALEATRRILGTGLLTIVLLFVPYTLWGHLLPGQLYHRPISLQYYIDTMVYTRNGVMGDTAIVAATYVFLFVGFGVFLEKANGGSLFSNIANALAGDQIGGPAKIAVISSGLYGTISGSPTADVMTTGSVTIPLMKKMGYSPVFAGAVEAVASTGGAVLPPVMGSAAFLMVQLTGTPYRVLATAAFLPAVLYYLGVYTQVHFCSKRLGLLGMPRSEMPRLRDALAQSWEFFLPFGVLVYMLLTGYGPAYTATAAIVTTIAVSWLRPANRVGLRTLVGGINTLIQNLAPLTAAVSAAAFVIAGLTVTGLGGRLITLIQMLAGNNVFLILVIAAVVSIILGMGMPLPAVYILTAVLIGPVLVDHGIPLLPAHLFLIYFSAMSAITPPVAVAAYSAGAIAQANPMQIGWQAVRLGIAAFLVPFVFIYDHSLLLMGSPVSIAWSAVKAIISIIAVSSGVEGYLYSPMSILERCMIGLGGLLLMVPGLISDALGIALLALVVARQWRQRQQGTGLAAGGEKGPQEATSTGR